MSDNYHHGNLRQALIDAGIKIINRHGEENLSLRKVASACNVSHAAPYAHFKDKDELIEEIKSTVTERFMNALEKSVKDSPDTQTALVNMGKAYVLFFIDNPDYFKFLFGSQNVTAHLNLDKNYKNDYPPFMLLKNTYLKYIKENGTENFTEDQELELLSLWSHVHGLASIACMSKVKVSFDWKDKILGDKLIR